MRTSLALMYLLIHLLSGGRALAESASILERSPVKTIYIVQLSHLDIGFTDTQSAVAKVSAQTIDHAIELCAADPDYKWTIESLWQLEQWTAGKSGKELETLFSLVKAGRIGLTALYAGMWSSTMGPEEVCRSLYPAEHLRSVRGVDISSAIQNDIPGCSWSYPQALRKAGIKYFLMGVNNFIGAGADIPVKDRPFYWEGPDGSRVLTWICSDFIGKESGYLLGLWEYGWGKGGRAEETVPKLLERLEEIGYPYDATLVIAGTGDNGGTNLSMTEGAREWNSRHSSPKMVIAHPDEFFEHMEKKYQNRFPVYRGDWSGLWDQNAQGTPYGTALSRQVHNELPATEVLATLADVLGLADYPDSFLRSAWREIITFDEHSGGGGWPGTLTYEQTLEGNITALSYAKTAQKLTRSVRTRSIAAVSSSIRTPADSIFVWNPAPSDRTALVRVKLDEAWFSRTFRLLDPDTGASCAYQKVKASRDIIFVARNVPGLGYKSFILSQSAEQSGSTRVPCVRVRSSSLENDYVRVSINEEGYVTSLYDKRSGRELIDKESRLFFGQLIQSSKQFSGPVQSGKADLRAGLCGPLAGSLVITREENPLASTEISLNADEPIVRLRHTIDVRRIPYHGYDDGAVKYDIAYPLNIPRAKFVFDTPGGFLDPTRDFMPGANRIVNVYRGGDIAGESVGVSFYSQQAFNWEFEQMNWLWGTPLPPQSTCLMMRLLSRQNETKYKEGVGKVDEEPGAPSLLVYEVAFRVHQGGMEPDRANLESFLASEANRPVALQIRANPKGTLPPSGTLIHINGRGVSLLTLKKAEDGRGYLLRLMETSGKQSRISISPGLAAIRDAHMADIVERSTRSLSLVGGRVTLGLSPHEIATLRLNLSPAP